MPSFRKLQCIDTRQTVCLGLKHQEDRICADPGGAGVMEKDTHLLVSHLSFTINLTVGVQIRPFTSLILGGFT